MVLLLYLLAFFTIGSAAVLEVDPSCPTCVVVNNTCHNASRILDLEAPFRKTVVIHKLSILRSENILFYSFEPKFEDPEYYKIGFINLDNQTIAGVISMQNLVLNFGAFDIDQDNGLVYMGGSDGIFLLDTNESKLSPYSSRGDSIKSLFYKNNVYFVKNSDNGIIVKKGDNFKTLFENIKIKNFVINKYDVAVFLNNLGLFVGKGETIVRISQNPFFRGLTMDLDGNIYAWWVDGIYKIMIDKILEDSTIEKVAHLPDIGAVTFDNNNNILFTSSKGLYRLVPSEHGCRVRIVKKHT